MTPSLHSPAIVARWQQMSLPEQLGNLGSEIHRTLLAQNQKERFTLARTRAAELLALTLADTRWHGAPEKELRLLQQQFEKATGDSIDVPELEALDKYCFQFGVLVAIQKKQTTP